VVYDAQVESVDITLRPGGVRELARGVPVQQSFQASTLPRVSQLITPPGAVARRASVGDLRGS